MMGAFHFRFPPSLESLLDIHAFLVSLFSLNTLFRFWFGPINPGYEHLMNEVEFRNRYGPHVHLMSPLPFLNTLQPYSGVIVFTLFPLEECVVYFFRFFVITLIVRFPLSQFVYPVIIFYFVRVPYASICSSFRFRLHLLFRAVRIDAAIRDIYNEHNHDYRQIFVDCVQRFSLDQV